MKTDQLEFNGLKECVVYKPKDPKLHFIYHTINHWGFLVCFINRKWNS